MARKKKRVRVLKPGEALWGKVNLGEEDSFESLLAAYDWDDVDAEKLGSKNEERRNPSKKPRRSGAGGPDLTIDLHGLKLEEAKRYVEDQIAQALSERSQPFRVRVITGKGRHSQGRGGVLAQQIHPFVQKKFARLLTSIDAAPDQSHISGVLLRGHFDMVLRPK